MGIQLDVLVGGIAQLVVHGVGPRDDLDGEATGLEGLDGTFAWWWDGAVGILASEGTKVTS